MAEFATAWAMYSLRSSLYRNGIYLRAQAALLTRAGQQGGCPSTGCNQQGASNAHVLSRGDSRRNFNPAGRLWR